MSTAGLSAVARMMYAAPKRQGHSSDIGEGRRRRDPAPPGTPCPMATAAKRVVFTICGGRQDDGRCFARLQAIEAARENRTAADERQRFPRKPARRQPRLQHDDRRPSRDLLDGDGGRRAGLRRPVAGSASRNTDSRSC